MYYYVGEPEMIEHLTEELIEGITHSDLNVLKQYLADGVHINRISSTGMTIIGMVAQTGNIAMMKMLIENIDVMRFKSASAKTCTSNILDQNTDGIIEEGPNKLPTTSSTMKIVNNNPMYKDQRSDRIEIWCRNLYLPLVGPNGLDDDIGRLDNNGCNVLHYAVRSGNLQIVQYLLDIFPEININQGNNLWSTVLHMACVRHDLPMIKYLMSKGANVNSECTEKRTPLHFAAQLGYTGVVDLLLNFGANIDANDSMGRSPLALAVEGNHVECVKLLIRRGAILNQEDSLGCSCLKRAVWNSSTRIVVALLEAGVRIVPSHCLIHVAVRNGNFPIVRALHGAGLSLNMRDEEGHTPLMVCSTYMDIEIFKYFLEHGANVNIPNSFNCSTVLHICVQEVRETPLVEQLIELLIDHGADLNIVGFQGSPLYASLTVGNLAAAKCLIQHGADVAANSEVYYFDNYNLIKYHGHLHLVKLVRYAGFNIKHMDIIQYNANCLRHNICTKQANEFIEHAKRNPMTLLQQCRIVIRKCLGNHLFVKIHKLQLPTFLHKYLKLEIL